MLKLNPDLINPASKEQVENELKDGVMIGEMAKRWIEVHKIKRQFTVGEVGVLMAFAKYLDEFIKGKDEEN